MNILKYYESKFKYKWDAAAIAHLVPSSTEAKFIYDHLLEVGPKQWLMDAGLGDVFGTINTDSREDSHDNHQNENQDNNQTKEDITDLNPTAKAFIYSNGRFETEDGHRLDDETLASLEFPSSSNIDIMKG